MRDTGQGIPSRAAPYVFDRFRQADGSSTRSQGGIGIDLALVRSLQDRFAALTAGFQMHVPKPVEPPSWSPWSRMSRGRLSGDNSPMTTTTTPGLRTSARCVR